MQSSMSVSHRIHSSLCHAVGFHSTRECLAQTLDNIDDADFYARFTYMVSIYATKGVCGRLHAACIVASCSKPRLGDVLLTLIALFTVLVALQPAEKEFKPDRVPVYCVCEMPYNPDQMMVMCKVCEEW